MKRIAIEEGKRILVYCIAGTFAAIIMAFPFSFDMFQLGDNGGYMTLAIALLQGKGFTDPAVFGSPHFLWWPAGFPIVLAIFIAFLGQAWNLIISCIYLLLYGSFVLFALFLYHSDRRYVKAVLVLVALCVSSGIHLLSSYLYSETFFCAATILFFVLWHRWQYPLTLPKILVLSCATIALASIRLVGLCLPVALTVWLLFFTKRDRQLRISSIIPMVLLCGYLYVSLSVPACRVESLRAVLGMKSQFRSVVTGSSVNEIKPVEKTSQRYLKKTKMFLEGFGLTLVPQSLIRTTYDSFTMNRYKAFAMGCVTCLVLLGWVRTFRRMSLVNLYVAFYFGILFFYGPLYVRLIVPLIPFLLYYFFTGIEYILDFLPGGALMRRGILYTIWGLVIIDNAYLTFTDMHRSMPPQFADDDYQKCIAWVVVYARPEQVVVTQVHSYLYLLRGKYCLPFNYPHSVNEFIGYLDQYRVKYVMLCPQSFEENHRYLATVRKAYQENNGLFRKVAGCVDDTGSIVLEYQKP